MPNFEYINDGDGQTGTKQTGGTRFSVPPTEPWEQAPGAEEHSVGPEDNERIGKDEFGIRFTGEDGGDARQDDPYGKIATPAGKQLSNFSAGDPWEENPVEADDGKNAATNFSGWKK
jgi:hypothetical protein